MILKGSQRAGGRQMALHLLNGEQNEHVNVHEVSGFVADDVMGALNEAYALSKGTKCKQFMYSLSLSPPQNEDVPIAVFEDTLKRVEKKLGLEGQPRVVVFHEKHGRRHAHCVWSRIDTDEMKAINISHPKLKLNTIAKSLYLEHGWQMPDGFKDKTQQNPLNYTRAEWQQAARTGQNPKTIKATLQECWAASDDKKSFENALQERGYYLAKGDRRGFVVIDIYGEVYSLTRQIGQKKKEIELRVGKADKLPSTKKTQEFITGKISKIYRGFLTEQSKDHQKELKPLLKSKHAMTRQHRTDRAAQKYYQENRWQKEERQRATKIRKGFKGFWDKLNGRYWKQRKTNEKETYQCQLRDQSEREHLIKNQLIQRQNLQARINQLQFKNEKERQNLIRDFSHMNNSKDKSAPDFSNIKEHAPAQSPAQTHKNQRSKDNGSPDIGMEPEL